MTRSTLQSALPGAWLGLFIAVLAALGFTLWEVSAAPPQVFAPGGSLHLGRLLQTWFSWWWPLALLLTPLAGLWWWLRRALRERRAAASHAQA